MLRALYYSTRYGSYLHSEHGIKELAEASLGQLIHRVTEKAAFFHERNQSLVVEKVNLLRHAAALSGQETLNLGTVHSVRSRLWGGTLLSIAAFLAAVILSHAAAEAFVEKHAVSFGFVAWTVSLVLALVLTGGGLFACERLLGALFSERAASAKKDGGRSAWPWLLLLIGVELAIAGISTVPADLLAERTASVLPYHGVFLVSMVLPLIAGFACWDATRQIDAYRNTQALHQTEIRLSQIEAILHQNEWEARSFYERALLACWNRFSAFKAYKERYNGRRGTAEALDFHFSESFQAFQAEANRRCGSSTSEAAALSVEQLARKLHAGSSRPAGEQPWRVLAEGDGHGAIGASEVQLAL